ncbi:multiple monosaccharide ABC transporter substrate-binding protein [Glycomyces harbinensis]|uniref:Putative multiple sugar transport system substrate-binding protein n=1 Tax=Glycomyces harbinensis TaxID=58114 RepID=A0A1G7BMR2_9ACTN|nr:multiple monosaccharide ABC transporter substrate-binding protein [Glycomyces harbinensis]SDE28384.1 putative multiple sugar transport system substrate-binding protein [Glycomyces harbinensis]
MNVNRRHLMTGTIGAAAVAMIASACASEDEGGGSGSGKKVGIAMPTKTSERWILDGDNLKASFEDEGYEVTLQYANDVAADQVSQIETMVGQNVDVLVIAAIDNKSLSGVLAQAKDQDITVIAYDRLILDTPDVDYYASFDNTKVGTLQGTYLVEALDLANQAGPFNIELFAGALTDNNAPYFFNGAWAVLEPFVTEGKLVVKSGQTTLEQVATENWDGAIAQERMDNILSNFYNDGSVVDAVLSPFDGISRGIIASLQGSGYTTMPVITGQDAELESVKYIISGLQAMTVYKDTRLLADTTVDMVLAVLDGKTPDINDEDTYDNGDHVIPAFLLEPVSVDVTNYEVELIDSGYIDAADLG